MDYQLNLQGLLKIAENEQQMLQRADQKAMGLISVIGVFCVFFINYYTKIVPNVFNLVFIGLYFLFVLLALWYLMLVIFPRYHRITNKGNTSESVALNTRELLKSYSFTNYLEKFYGINNKMENDNEIFQNYISSLGKINLVKSKNLKRGISAFIIAILSELLIIFSMYVSLFMNIK